MAAPTSADIVLTVVLALAVALGVAAGLIPSLRALRARNADRSAPEITVAAEMYGKLRGLLVAVLAGSAAALVLATAARALPSWGVTCLGWAVAVTAFVTYLARSEHVRFDGADLAVRRAFGGWRAAASTITALSIEPRSQQGSSRWGELEAHTSDGRKLRVLAYWAPAHPGVEALIDRLGQAGVDIGQTRPVLNRHAEEPVPVVNGFLVAVLGGCVLLGILSVAMLAVQHWR